MKKNEMRVRGEKARKTERTRDVDRWRDIEGNRVTEVCKER